jgi:hypothetical protein
MVKNGLILTIALFSSYVQAQPSLEDQISAVNNSYQTLKAEESERRAEQTRQAEAKAVFDREQSAKQEAEYRKTQMKLKAESEATAKAKASAAQAAAKLKDEERLKDKNRNQSFEDEVRQLAIEERRIELAEKKAKAARVNEFLDQDLNRQKAHTDVVQSEADATRNISEGAKDMMKGVGKGAEKGIVGK